MADTLSETFMEIIYVLLPLSIGLGVIFVVAFCWSARSGQFEDLETPAVRMLPEDFDTQQ